MERRIENIKQKIKNDKIGAIFVTSANNIFYLTGLQTVSTEEREYYLFVTEKNAFLIAPKMFMLAVKNKSDLIQQIEITKEKNLYNIIKEICASEKIKTVGFEEDNLLYKEFDHLVKNLSEINFIPIENFIEDERIFKEEDEIVKLKKACLITDNTYSHILKFIKEGISEKEVTLEIENFIKKNNSELAFPPIVAFGKNSAVPHHIANDTKLLKNSFVLLDFGAKYEGYCADMSRTLFFGNPNADEIKLYNTVLESQKIALKKLAEWKDENFQTSHLHEIAKSYIENNGYESFPHALGHGVGIQVHEEPGISIFSEGNDLKSNMVITIEPAIYKTDIGGVRIEDDVLLSEDGFEILTKSPNELTIIK